MTLLRAQRCVGAEHGSSVVIPAQAGIHFQSDSNVKMDPGVRQDDAAANCVTFGRINCP
jgi:hypothetical protein